MKKKNLTIINDSKSTSFASSENLLKSLNKVYWILGGIPKKNDKFRLTKKIVKILRLLYLEIMLKNLKTFKK